MREIRIGQRGFEKVLRQFSRRAVPAEDVQGAVSEIISAVRQRGDRALIEFAKRFDGASLKRGSLRVADEDLGSASAELDGRTRGAIRASLRNVMTFAKRSLRTDWEMTNEQGALVGEVFRPYERVGVYVPGGSAPLVSTALMTVALAKAAGVPEIVVCTPCGSDLRVNAALLHALKVSGATEVYRVGGAQAIAALAFGTRTITPVAKIFGPGNKYVVEAKRQAVGAVSIDLLPGPSEVLVLADSSADPRFIAADILAQAEHGGESQVGFLTDSESLFQEVKANIGEQAQSLPRQEAVREVLQKNTVCVLLESLEQGVELVNAYAPEHLSLVVRREKTVLRKIRTAGAIFVGNQSPGAVGDFLAGPSHTLPTGGAGKSFPGLTVDMFQRRTSIVRLDRAAMRRSAKLVETFAELEGLDAHGRSATIRVS